MRAAWRVADVRSAERAYLATLPPGTLMARAAAALARRCAGLLADRFGSVYGRSVVLVVGSGDNGGDALYAGALLARRGCAVRVLPLARDRVHPGGLAALSAAGGRIVSVLPPAVDLAIDGIVGIGGHPPLRAEAAAIVDDLTGVRAGDGGRPTIVAVDVPSGVDVDSGDLPGASVIADVTVTFGCLKPALVVGPAAPRAGLVDLVDIGLGPWLRGTPMLRVPEASDIVSWWPLAGPASDKYTRGVAGVATGSPVYSGAAVLSVAGATAGPIGLVRYAGAADEQVRLAHPAAITAPRVADAGRVQAWVCGSGLGTDARAIAELRAVLASPVPVCLDADALTLLTDGSTAATADLLRSRSAPLVITPHDREFARLAGGPVGRDRTEAALGLAAKMRATVLLKGDRTVVACPDGTAWVNPTGTPALATAGSGDVLAGLIGALLAAGLPPVRAAVTGAFIHGLAGRSASDGGRPITASDVAGALPRAITALIGQW